MIRLRGVDHPNVPTAVEQAFAATINDIAHDMNTYCKEDTGALKGSLDFNMKNEKVGVIWWDREYAAYAYYKGRPSHDKNPDAHLRWAEYAKNKHGKQWQDDIAKRAAKLWK